MSEDDLKLAEFTPDPVSLRALGFVDFSNIPRHYFMSVSEVFALDELCKEEEDLQS